jgi:hypothetical protein
MKLSIALTLVGLLLSVAPAFSQNAAPGATAPAPDLTSPEAAVRSFVEAVNRLDTGGANCLVGGKIDRDLNTWVERARKSGETLRITVVSITPQLNGDTATVAVSEELSNGREKQQFDETVSLRHTADGWKIVPPTEAELEALTKGNDKNPHALATLAVIYTHPAKMLAHEHQMAADVACRSNLKQLATAVLVFMQDNDDKFPAKAAAFVTTVWPYVKTDDIFHCPAVDGKVVTYSMNPQLQGKRMTAVRKPELTVLLYEGKNGTLNFRHNGRAMVAMANGKVIQVNATEAKRLRWAP